jgi:BirA family biotin operon repressor/biotin-[acetyl-CoA-carboxylase] ligase
MTVATWRSAADPSRPIGHAVEHHARIGSTNDRARQALREPGGEGLAVVADEQTAGRGRRGRTWLSPPGLNLLVSVGLRPALEARDAGLLGVAAALAVRQACQGFSPQPLRIRWPNDIVTADGAKLAGLLVETALDGTWLAEAVIGMGINANWRAADMPAEIGARATSLADLAGTDVDRVALLGKLLRALDDEVAALQRGSSPVDRFRSVSALDGRRLTVDLGGELLDGVGAGIGEDGALLLDAPAGRVALTSGEVVAVRDSAPRGAVA